MTLQQIFSIHTKCDCVSILLKNESWSFFCGAGEEHGSGGNVVSSTCGFIYLVPTSTVTSIVYFSELCRNSSTQSQKPSQQTPKVKLDTMQPASGSETTTGLSQWELVSVLSVTCLIDLHDLHHWCYWCHRCTNTQL